MLVMMMALTESLSHPSLSETAVLPSLSQLITIGYQLQRNLTQLLVSIMHLSVSAFFPKLVNVLLCMMQLLWCIC